MKRILAMSIGLAVVLCCYGNSARALPQFKKAFKAKYVDATGANPALAAAFETASCNTCHIKGKPKKVRNDYGQALSKLIPGGAKKRLDAAEKKGGDEAKKAEMAKILTDLDTAFSKVESEKSPAGPTYGEQIKAGKLP